MPSRGIDVEGDVVIIVLVLNIVGLNTPASVSLK